MVELSTQLESATPRNNEVLIEDEPDLVFFQEEVDTPRKGNLTLKKNRWPLFQVLQWKS